MKYFLRPRKFDGCPSFSNYDDDIDDEIMDDPDFNIDAENEPSKKKRPVRYTIKNPMIDAYTVEECEYFLKTMNSVDKEKIVASEKRMMELNQDSVPLRFKILSAEIDDKIKAAAIQRLNQMYQLDAGSGEYHKILHWIQSVCKIPFNKYKPLPVSVSSPREEIRDFLMQVKNRMDTTVYGHKDAKDHIIRLLAQWISSPQSKGMVIGIHGPMGCGKTTLIKDSICASLGLPFAFIPLGGANDGCYLEGHSYTYEGATWGKIVDVLMKCGCMNPVLFFDELDKVSTTQKGEEIINLLIHLTDATQNEKITDKYFSEFEFDLSRSLIIFSYNNEENVNPILRDRMIKIQTNGYSISDKIRISKDYMIPELLKDYGFSKGDIILEDEVIKNLINIVDDEQGVRNLRRALADVVSNLNLAKFLDFESSATEMQQPITFPYKVSDKDVKKYVFGRKTQTSGNIGVSMMYC